MWMGTHPNGLSNVLLDENQTESIDLLRFLSQNPNLLGTCTWNKYKDLPFLFEILSIAKPASIQAHPDKELALKLHASKPHIYPDAQYKPL